MKVEKNMEIRSYEEFFKKVKARLEELLGKDYTLYQNHVRKNNDVWLDGIIIRKGMETICPTIYLDKNFYKVNKEKDIDTAAKYILNKYQEALTCDICQNVDLSYEYAMPRIIYRLKKKKKNEELLKKCPSVPFLDLAITFHILLDKMINKEQATIQITNHMMSLWNIDTTTLAKFADENTKKYLPPAIYTMREMLGKIMLDEMQQIEIKNFERKSKISNKEEQKNIEIAQLEEIEKFKIESAIEEQNRELGKTEMYVLTNTQNIYGATSIIYKDILRDFSQSVHCDLYLLPSSIHEFILIPAKRSFEKENLEDMVQLVNRTQLPKEEFLSDFVYYYYQKEEKIIKL